MGPIDRDSGTSLTFYWTGRKCHDPLGCTAPSRASSLWDTPASEWISDSGPAFRRKAAGFLMGRSRAASGPKKNAKSFRARARTPQAGCSAWVGSFVPISGADAAGWVLREKDIGNVTRCLLNRLAVAWLIGGRFESKRWHTDCFALTTTLSTRDGHSRSSKE